MKVPKLFRENIILKNYTILSTQSGKPSQTTFGFVLLRYSRQEQPLSSDLPGYRFASSTIWPWIWIQRGKK